jgi:hypothetical protein
MFEFVLRLCRLIWLFTCDHHDLVLENLALRQQLAIYKRKQKRPRLNRWDRLFWISLAGCWQGWRKSLLVVHPDTVVRWRRDCRYSRNSSELPDDAPWLIEPLASMSMPS